MGKRLSKNVRSKNTCPQLTSTAPSESHDSSSKYSQTVYVDHARNVMTLTGWSILTDKPDTQRQYYDAFEKTGLIVSGSLPSTLWGWCVGACALRGMKAPGKPIQDNFSIVCDKSYTVFCLADGHGAMGHQVANTICQSLPAVFLQKAKILTDVRKSLNVAFSLVQNALGEYADESGAATVLMVMPHNQKRIHVAHVGDCRAVLFKNVEGILQGITLTTDHKPHSKIERDRIERAGGEVRDSDRFHGPRLFVRNKHFPGYAMSRSLGDKFGTSIGMSSIPDISEVKIKSNDALLVLGSDGLFEFSDTSEFCLQLQRHAPCDANTMAESLCDFSRRKWLKQQLLGTDDISAIVINLRKLQKLFTSVCLLENRTAYHGSSITKLKK